MCNAHQFLMMCSEGGYFNAILSFPRDYPNSPPTCRFTSDMWHPNGQPPTKLQLIDIENFKSHTGKLSIVSCERVQYPIVVRKSDSQHSIADSLVCRLTARFKSPLNLGPCRLVKGRLHCANCQLLCSLQGW